MKKIIMLSVLALMCVCVRAQHTVYCEIIQFNTGTPKAVISVDFGNKGTDEIVDENGKKVKFKSSVDALSYFEKLGWSVVSAYSVLAYNGLANVPTVRYLLQKKVASYDEKMDGIRIKKCEPKKKINLGDDGYFE